MDLAFVLESPNPEARAESVHEEPRYRHSLATTLFSNQVDTINVFAAGLSLFRASESNSEHTSQTTMATSVHKLLARHPTRTPPWSGKISQL